MVSFMGPANSSNIKFDSEIELIDGQVFCWNCFTTVSYKEIDSRISILSQNIPKNIKNNKSIQDKISEMALISPLWSTIEITPEIDRKNRETIFFFEIVAQQECEPMQLFLKKEGNFNRYAIEPTKADLLARKMRFFSRRIAKQPSSEYLETLDGIVELNFDGMHLEFLPDEIGLFKNLHELKLAGCNLTELPVSIGELKKLSHLNLAGNPLTDLPKTISNCSNLQVINLTGNKLSYSLLLDIANDFFLKGNAWGAVQVAVHAINNPEESWLTSPYTEVVELLKKIIEKIFLKDGNFKGLHFHIIAAIDKIPNDNHKFVSFLEILKRVGNAKKNISEDDLSMEDLLKFQNITTNKCIEIANLFPENLGKHRALCNISKVLFSIDCHAKGFEVAELAIELSNSRPKFNYLTMVNDVNGSELEIISNILKNTSEKLVKEKRFNLATQAANLIPIERERSRAFRDMEFFQE